MRIVKPNQLSLITRPFEYRQAAYLGFSIVAGVPLTRDMALCFEADLWKQVTPLLGEAGFLDAGIPKSRGEFLVVGAAHAPPGEPAAAMRVKVSVGALTKELYVFGERFFEGDQITEPLMFERMPVDWPHAFGGEKFADNPYGKGIQPVASGPQAGRLPLPNVEHPERLLRLRNQRPEPAGLGATELVWPRRLRLAGTYDDNWLKTAFPGFPDDIHWDYFNIAQSDQWADAPWQGGEAFRIAGMHPDAAVIEGTVPEIATRCFFRLQGEQALQEAMTSLTTLWFFPEIDLLVPIYQGSIRIAEADGFDVETLLIAAEWPDEGRALEHYEQVLERRTSPEASLLDLIRDEPLMPDGLARSPADDIIAGLGSGDESPFVQNLHNSLDHAIEEIRSKTVELGHEFPEDQVPEWPQQEELPAIDDLDQFFDRKIRDLEQALEQAKAKEQEARALVQEELNSKPDFDRSLDDVDSESDQRGPPQFSAAAAREQIQDACERVRAMGSDPSEMEAMLNDPEMAGLWQDAESGLNDVYRMGAHYQEPIGRSRDSKAGLAWLRDLLARGESVVDQNFCGLDLSNQDFSGKDLTGVFLESADLTGANLTGATLDRAVLAHANLEGCRLDDASLKQVNLGKTKLVRVSARGCRLDDAILSGAELVDCDFTDAAISGMQTFFQARVNQCCFAGMNGRELVFLEMDLKNCDFSRSNQQDGVFVNCDLSQSRWDDASIDELVFVSCIAREASFARAGLCKVMLAKECDFSESDFTAARLDQANLRDARLMHCQFGQSRLKGADLSNTMAGGSSFRLAAAQESRWVRADLRDSDLAGLDLSNSVLHKADLRGADIEQANLHAADLARVHVDRSTRFDGALTTRMNTYPRLFGRERPTDA